MTEKPGYTRSHFTGQVEPTTTGYIISIESDEGSTWLKIHVGKEDDHDVLVEFQFIIENLKQFIMSITDASKGDADGIYVDYEGD